MNAKFLLSKTTHNVPFFFGNGKKTTNKETASQTREKQNPQCSFTISSQIQSTICGKVTQVDNLEFILSECFHPFIM